MTWPPGFCHSSSSLAIVPVSRVPQYPPPTPWSFLSPHSANLSVSSLSETHILEDCLPSAPLTLPGPHPLSSSCFYATASSARRGSHCLSRSTTLGPYTHLFLSSLAESPYYASPARALRFPAAETRLLSPHLWLALAALPISSLPTTSPLSPPFGYSLPIFQKQPRSSLSPGSFPGSLGWRQASWKLLVCRPQYRVDH